MLISLVFTWFFVSIAFFLFLFISYFLLFFRAFGGCFSCFSRLLGLFFLPLRRYLFYYVCSFLQFLFFSPSSVVLKLIFHFLSSYFTCRLPSFCFSPLFIHLSIYLSFCFFVAVVCLVFFVTFLVSFFRFFRFLLTYVCLCLSFSVPYSLLSQFCAFFSPCHVFNLFFYLC